MRIILCVALLLGGCLNAPSDSIGHPENPPIVQGDMSNLLVYYSECEASQPASSPMWCDFYEDGGACCTWIDAGFHEEWCQYPDNWCWEANGGW